VEVSLDECFIRRPCAAEGGLLQGQHARRVGAAKSGGRRVISESDDHLVSLRRRHTKDGVHRQSLRRRLCKRMEGTDKLDLEVVPHPREGPLVRNLAAPQI